MSKRDIEVEYTGLREGEKLHEALLATDELDHRPAHPLVSHVTVPVVDASLLREISRRAPSEIRDAMQRITGGMATATSSTTLVQPAGLN